MKKKRKVVYNILSVFLISSAISCMQINATELDTEPQGEVASADQPMLMASAASVQASAPAAAASSSEGGLYSKMPEPLTVEQCAQCHTSVFVKIKDNGGKHRIHCQDCHEQFHSYSPVKQNWNEIMPKCSQCHDEPHGSKHVDCMKCHIIPHTPLVVPTHELLNASCADCHSGPAGELQQFPSMHTQQECSSCHYTHGEIPSCMDCHSPHVDNQPVAECLACHPVHRPLQISYDAGTEATCGACHDSVYATWSSTPSKHSGVACADCHVTHGNIPECTMCHTQPHDPKMLAKFPRCLDCHMDAHNPPVNR